MGNIRDTQYFQAVQDKKMEARDVLEQVYIALTEKGYNPVNQIVGYIMSGDPTYITSHRGARSLIMKVERDELLEELLAVYIEDGLRAQGWIAVSFCWQKAAGAVLCVFAQCGAGFVVVGSFAERIRV